MDITVDWPRRLIHVPRESMPLIQSSPTEIRQLDLNQFRLRLKDLEDDIDGIVFPDTHQHNTSVEVGGVVLARVIEIINGYTVTFEDGLYAVNLAGANSNVADVSNVNRVSVRSANSAGLQDLSTLLAAAYQGTVFIDVETGISGTSVPIGTLSTPVNNIHDAIIIAQSNGLQNIGIIGHLDLFDVDVGGYNFIGQSTLTSSIYVDPVTTHEDCTFKYLSMTGCIGSDTSCSNCEIDSATIFQGKIHSSGIRGIISIRGDSYINIIDSHSVDDVDDIPILDMNGTESSNVFARKWAGNIRVRNMSGNQVVSLSLDEGTAYLDSSVNSGTIVLSGTGELVSNAGENVTIVNNMLSGRLQREALTTGEFIALQK